MNRKGLLLGIILVTCLGFMAGQVRALLVNPAIMPPDDFVEYWAAGRLNLQGQNPYSAELLLPLQIEAGRDTDEAIMMWNPPWTLPAVMPLGLLPAREAQLVWLLLNLGVVLLCADLLWRRWGGPVDRRWVAWAIALTFLPTFFVLRAGQITPFVMLGVVGFVELQSRGRAGWAGAAAVLMAFKPHLLILVWVAIAVQALFTRRLGTVLGGIVGGGLATAVAYIFNLEVFSHYLEAYRQNPPVQWMSLTLGTLLRSLLGPEKFWLNAVPCVLAVVWFLFKYTPQRQPWSWAERMPELVLVSFVMAPYGAWHFDLVLLLVPILHRTVTLTRERNSIKLRLALIAYLFATFGMIAVNIAGLTSIWFAWVAPLTLVMYYATAPRVVRDLPPKQIRKVPLGVPVNA